MLVSVAAAATSAALSLAAASDLELVLPKLIRLYEDKHPETRDKITATYGPSGSLLSQVESGAPFDLFFSADASFADRAVTEGLAAAADDQLYAQGELVLWVRTQSKLDLKQLGMRALTDPSVKHIAIANPRHAPYGRAAEAAIRAAGLTAATSARLVYGESVAQTAQFVASGAVDIGVIAGSLAVTPGSPLASSGRAWLVPAELYPPLEQKGVVLKRASDPALARAFFAFVRGEGQAVLKDSGFRVGGALGRAGK